MYYRLFFIFLILSSSCGFSQKFRIEKEADWIKLIDIPTKSLVKKYDVSAGYYLTLADRQINLDQNASYTRDVINVVSYSGITQASQLSVTYDTSYQQLNIHHLYIWRNGDKIDRTGDLSFKILNNEYNLHIGIYMGLITAYCNLNDIRKDDLIDFSYTLVGKNPIFNDGKYLFIPLESNNPIDLYSIRIWYSKDKEYQYKCTGCDSATIITNSEVGHSRQLEISLYNIKPVKLEDNIPGWIIPFKYFSLSSFKTWKEVNNWAQQVFALNNEPDLTVVFNEIFSGNETMDEKINKVINYVQDDIRYMGIESGIGSIKPFPPDQVVKQRFGDCKDKSLLLVSLLKKIGIDKAYPVLVNTNMKQNLDEFYPSNEVFNHCIVKFEFNDTTHWVDPTLTQQGGDWKDLSIIDHGKALVIRIPSDTLSEMPVGKGIYNIKITDEYSMKSFTDPASLVIKSVRHGLEADIRRILIEQHPANEFSKRVTEDLKRYYPTVNTTKDLKIEDDIDKNVFSMTYQYEIDGFWQDGDKMPDKESAGYWFFKFEPFTLYTDFNLKGCMKRTFDYALNFPLNMTYTVIFHCPKDLLVYDKYTKYENESFSFDEKIEQLSSNSFQVMYNYKTKSQIIKAGDYEKICEEKSKIAKTLPIIIYFNK
ncbi:MAG: DUF3857 domain-containing protein [Alphaproteobacteria bacterium]|nr:DUF3857 domain-containing protein [Alphaproteobacteria bacterium]